MHEFSLGKFVVCTDAGLGSMANRLYNNAENRAFVVTQSLKKMENSLREWALDPNGWTVLGDTVKCNLTQINDVSDNINIYYKERKTREEVKDEYGKKTILEQKMIVSYLPKYRRYQREVRAGQIERAAQMANRPARLSRKKANDPARFVEQTQSPKKEKLPAGKWYSCLKPQ
jgi:hypothetical protein